MSNIYECKRHPYSDLYEKLMNDKQCFGHGDYRVRPLSIEAAIALSELAQKVDSQTWRIERLEKVLEVICDTDPDDGTAWFHATARAALEGK